MISLYNSFLLENKIYELILESKLVFSQNFINILSLVPSNDKVGQELKKFTNNNIEIDNLMQNYIDISDSKERLTFIQDRRASNFQSIEKYMVIDSNRVLTYGSANDYLYEILNFDKSKQERYVPNNGEECSFIAETPNKAGTKIYVLMKSNDNDNLFVINKEGIKQTTIKDPAVWTTYRNPINVGRLVRSILQQSNIQFTDSEIETFVNNYKSIYDIVYNDSFSQFDIVKGDKIPYWYDGDRYSYGGGTLNNSCMSNVNTKFFDIYRLNVTKVSMVILYEDGGTLEGKRYISDKIKGRAILWDVEIDGENAKFLDRIYTLNDSDVNLFKEFAKSNGWWYKSIQNIYYGEAITNGTITKRDPKIICSNIDTDHEYYPYLDTLCFVEKHGREGALYNYMADDVDGVAKDTDGELTFD